LLCCTSEGMPFAAERCDSYRSQHALTSHA
jgi:hypothetical protein